MQNQTVSRDACWDHPGNLLWPLLPSYCRSVDTFHWFSSSSRFPIHPKPGKSYASQISVSSFMRYVGSQNLRVIKSNVITLDCYWMCKKSQIYISHPSMWCFQMVYAMSLYHLKGRAGGMSHRGLLSQGLFNNKCSGGAVCTRYRDVEGGELGGIL